jgi:gluconate 2-dehydrogenase alpha chain
MIMSTVINEPAVQVVVLGVGYMSGVVATELATQGYKVVAITKGPYWDYVNDFSMTKYDEWGVGLERKYDHPLPLQSTTIRNDSSQFALPVRRYTMPIQYHALGHGVGGAAQHYGGGMGRFGPWAYQMQSLTNASYPGLLNAVNPQDDTHDWPLTYAQYEPYYVEWEKAHGICGNYNGSPNNSTSDMNYPWMSTNYPLPPHPLTPLGQLFQTTVQGMTAPNGQPFHPFPSVSALASQPYTNQYGVTVNPCVYDGYCGGPCDYACETGAKANAAYRTIPAAIKSGNFTLVTNAYVYRLDYDSTANQVIAARYYDAQGNVHVQPGTVFFNGMWGYNMIRLMLLSGVGTPYVYNPGGASGTGTVGRGLTNGYTPYRGTNVSGTVNIGGNSYPAGNGSGGGMSVFDLMDDNFSHANLNFIGGGLFGAGGYMGGGPGNITMAGGVGSGSMGSTFKQTQQNKYLPTKQTVGATPFAPDLPTLMNYIDLDPHYTDAYGDPVSRLTYDWTPNTYNGATYLVNQIKTILTAMGATNVTVGSTVAPYSAHNDWWGHHLRGGLRVGNDPNAGTATAWAALSGYNQLYLTNTTGVNYFAAGEITNTTGNNATAGTHAAGPQSYRAVEGIKRYLANGGVNYLA